MALEVARGMQALEESVPPILHRDLKPTNVFIGAPPRENCGIVASLPTAINPKLQFPKPFVCLNAHIARSRP